MGTGILVCGLNGCGKSTLGKALAETTGFHFIDNEDLYFPKLNPGYPYDSLRSDEEVEELFLHEARTHENFIFAAVKGNYGKGNYGENILSFYKYAVLIDVPKDIRLQRVKDRSYQKFGDRMLPGGNLYEREEVFFDLVSSRTESEVEEWVRLLTCPIIRVDGTLPIEENIILIVDWLRNQGIYIRRCDV